MKILKRIFTSIVGRSKTRRHKTRRNKTRRNKTRRNKKMRGGWGGAIPEIVSVNNNLIK